MEEKIELTKDEMAKLLAVALVEAMMTFVKDFKVNKTVTNGVKESILLDMDENYLENGMKAYDRLLNLNND